MDTVSPARSPQASLEPGTNDFLPPPSALAMAPQSLWEKPAPRRRAATSPRTILLRRALILSGTAALTAVGLSEMYFVLSVGDVTLLEALLIALFAVLFAWVAFSFTTTMAGFAVLLFGRGDGLVRRTRALPANLQSRTAMLLPTYNEDPDKIMARLRATCESVRQTGHGAAFDWFVLSDTTDPAVWIDEEAALLRLRAECTGERIFYRHRAKNVARKSGNIAEWVQRFGGGYEFMIVLDADSLMQGDAIVRLVDAMERHPGVGLIQTLPVVINAQTLFARLQQFAGRLYGPMVAAGIAWWHGAESNYWGHNAIIRIRAFAENAGLPELPGRKPFGGHILSHDFVEAALLRRGGWAVHIVPSMAGSFEECPPSLIDFAARDRRWCQGNLQHVLVLPARGLSWVSRLHFLTGIGCYITAPLWLVFLILGILISLQAQFIRPDYFPEGFALFPHWPRQDPVRAAWLFAGTMAMLLVPKLLALLLVLVQGERRRGFGVAFLPSLLIEIVLSGLMAPVMMIFQSAAVAEILTGRDAGWQVQRRDNGAVPIGDIARRFAAPTLLGMVLGAGAYAVSLPLFLWMLPVILGLALAIPIALLTSQPIHPGSWLFATPEVREPPAVLRRANAFSFATEAPGHPADRLRQDKVLLLAHIAALPEEPTRRRGEIDGELAIARAKVSDARDFNEALAFLTKGELFKVFGERAALAQLMALPLSSRS
jgi:membrane glycosyltransferase